ncbi:uncharacterized protein EI90DRAFT_3191839 [Cantharellus anzutake]|uniref:uncharacterized protein n=1 Tax=Cantharellus anzutake TaxID=1750568 RepID=UPI001907D652|nr:uncharacterized protein EI90DRAFT_3191839 [Cantharellus anzutake]KAF8343040.1 hypothetical protein EI90DRAFT_3191839 [Cantharellus anzutake]
MKPCTLVPSTQLCMMLSLPPITLSSLEKGLTALKNNAQPLIDELKAKLASGLSVTEDEEAWLDGSANFTDEALLIAELQHAEDFQSSFDSLSASQKATVQPESCRQWQFRLAFKGLPGSQRAIPDMEPLAKKGPVFTHKETATLWQHIKILDWYHKNGKNQTKPASHFDPICYNRGIAARSSEHDITVSLDCYHPALHIVLIYISVWRK